VVAHLAHRLRRIRHLADVGGVQEAEEAKARVTCKLESLSRVRLIRNSSNRQLFWEFNPREGESFDGP
jgi:hypothetical protein